MIQAVPAHMSSVLEISEWDEHFLPDATLSSNDRQLAQQLLPSRRLMVDEMLNGVHTVPVVGRPRKIRQI